MVDGNDDFSSSLLILVRSHMLSRKCTNTIFCIVRRPIRMPSPHHVVLLKVNAPPYAGAQ